LVATNGIFFILTATYLSESAIDLTEPPTLTHCQNPLLVYVDENDVIHVDDKIVTKEEIETVLNGLASTETDVCLRINVSENTSYGSFAAVVNKAKALGLDTQMKIIVE